MATKTPAQATSVFLPVFRFFRMALSTFPFGPALISSDLTLEDLRIGDMTDGYENPGAGNLGLLAGLQVFQDGAFHFSLRTGLNLLRSDAGRSSYWGHDRWLRKPRRRQPRSSCRSSGFSGWRFPLFPSDRL